MNKLDIMQNIALNIEKERIKLGLSQRKMAEKLDLHQTTYRNLINGDMKKIDIFTFLKLYELTGKLAFEYIGIQDEKLTAISKIKDMNEEDLTFLDNIINYMKRK